MGIASLVLGIVSIVMSLIPGIGWFFSITAIIGIILGIISLCKKKDKGKSIAGIVTSVIAIIIMIIYGVITAAIVGEASKAIKNSANYNYDYSNETSSETTKNQADTKEYVAGETYKDSNLGITFVSVNENFTDYNKYATVKEGTKIVKAEFEFENVGDKPQYVSSYDFDCYADGYDCDSFWSVENSSFSSNLSTGKKIKGSVYFQVPTNANKITLEYDVNSYEGQIATFKIK